MRSIAVLAAVCGLALLTGLTVYYGLGAVAAAVVSSGWATVLVVAVRGGRRHWLVGSGPGAPTRTFGFRTAAIRPRGHQLVLSSGGDRWRCSRGKAARPIWPDREFGFRQRADRHLHSTRLSILFRAGGAWHRA